MSQRSEIKEKLKKECAPVGWSHIQPHSDRDAVIVIDPSLDIIEVGTEIAEDNSSFISSTIAAGHIAKPLPQQITAWNQSGASFLCLIVSPYVLIQPIVNNE